MTEPTAKSRIADALTGKVRGKGQLVAVANLDVLAVAEAVPEEKRTKTTAALLKGARGAGQLDRDGNDVSVEVHVNVDDLFHLLTAAGA